MASEAKRMTSPWVTSATVGMFLDTLGTLSSVFWTSEMRRSRPSPEILVSNFPLNFPNSSIFIKLAKFSLVNAFSGSNPLQSDCCSHHVTANSVTERKIFPLDQHTTCFSFSNFSLRVATVVPFPVPESPQSTTTPPPSPPFFTLPKISSATSPGLFPNTSILIYSSGTKSGSNTPFSLAMSIPFCNLEASSSSRWRMPSPSDLERARNSGLVA
mmetsp:Transcript_263/g.503  ORF Transcript_263/g.503 Transcript_263/m.503 type:complete len:214 (+) Transcript_263:404-1045(+)